MFGIANKELYMTRDELALLEEELGGDVGRDPIILIHSATLLVPCLINVGFIPMSKTVSSVMDFTSEEIAVACRIMVLDLYGIMFPLLLNKWNIKKEEDINSILTAFQSIDASPSMNVAHKISITGFDFDEILDPEPLFVDDDLDEVEMAGETLYTAQTNTSIRGSSMQSEDPKGIKDLLMGMFGDLFKPPDEDA